MSRPKKLKTYIPEDRQEISPSDLLKTNKNILLVGKPGIGKTALSHEILKLWAERDSRELEYMFYFDMRERSLVRDGMSLEELLFSAYSEPDEDKEEVFQDIKKYSDNVTVVFDGITDLSSSVVRRIVEKDLLPNAKVIITCRPDDEDLFSGDFDRVEVKGFSEQTIEKYFSAMLGMEQKKVLSNLELLTLCHVPMYALMVAVCFLYETPEDSPQPCSMTEIYINIVHFCLQTSSNKKHKNLNTLIKQKSADLLTLAEAAFHATEEKTVSLTDLHCEDSCVLSFLKPLVIKVAPIETTTTYAFLHYTMQEFFAAMWLLKNPDKIKEVFQQCLTEERKHMKHMIPFMCRLLTKKSPSLMEHLIPAQELKKTSNLFFKEMISTFFSGQCMEEEAHTEDTGLDVGILFLCQCLFESQCPDTCTSFLEKLEYQLDLSSESLDSYLCCAVAYVVSQSKERKIQLNLEDVSVSAQGMSCLYGCLFKVQWCDPLPKQLWEIVLLSEEKLIDLRLLDLDGNQLHLLKQLFERAAYVIQNNPRKINVCLHWDNRATTACQSLCGSLLEVLSDIRSLSFRMAHQDPEQEDQEPGHGTLERRKKKLLLDLCLQAALDKEESFHHVVSQLVSLFSVDKHLHNFFVDLYQHVKSEGCLSVIPKLGQLFESAAGVWSINLSEINTSILLEVLRLRPEKTPVKLTGCPDEESEVRSFLQCLPHISQLSFRMTHQDPEQEDQEPDHGTLERRKKKLLLDLCLQAALDKEESFHHVVSQLVSLFSVDKHLHNFFVDLYQHVKSEGCLSVIPKLGQLFESAADVWSINLSEINTSMLLEVLKLRSEKTPVKLTGCFDEESEVRSFLQCLPHISQLSFSEGVKRGVELCGRLFCAAAEREQQTGENTVQLLSSVCTYEAFSYLDEPDFFLELYSHMKDCETKTGLRVLPSLQSVFQSAPAVWYIDLSKRKTSILLEVLRLRPEKTPVELTGCPDEESEVRSFLQCLPHISQLSFRMTHQDPEQEDQEPDHGTLERRKKKLLLDLCLQAALDKEESFHHVVSQLVSLFSVDKHLHNFFVDLYQHVKSEGCLSVIPKLGQLFESAAGVWSINLSEINTSMLLEVLRLRSEKTPVELTGCPDEESEVRSFLQCLPHISQLSFSYWFKRGVELCGRLFCAAAEREQQTGENTLQLLSSLCTYETFPFIDKEECDDNEEYQCSFLLDLYSHMKDCETKTGLRVLPSLQSVFQSAPDVWYIDLSKRKTSILLEVLRLRPEKTPVELTGCPDEESEVRSFLQCLPHISQLSFSEG
uniref:Si:ch211-108d22.2 n=1 Tax=Labrus bergylta TaxID=56723 RepID=A0A3Q3MIE9_9LABR